QHGSIDQGISGTADATAPQHADVSQNANPPEGGTTLAHPADATTPAPNAPAESAAQSDAAAAPAATGAGDAVGGAVDGATGAVGGAVDGATGAVDGAAGTA